MVVTLLSSCTKTGVSPRGDGGADLPRKAHDIDRPADQQQFVAPGMEGLIPALRAAPPAPRDGLAAYQPYTAPRTTADPSRFRIRQIVVKFVEGSGVRLRDGELQALPAAENTTRSRLSRRGLEPAAVTADLAAIARLLKAAGATASPAAPRLGACCT